MLRVPLLKQQTGYTCGPTCMQMLTRFYGKEVSWAEIIRASKIDRNGMSNEDMVRALRKLRFIVHAKKRNTWKDLQENYRNRYPTIIAWMLHGYIGHFSVVVAVNNTYIMLADPDTGRRRKLSKDVFMRLWFDYDDVFFPKRAKDLHLRWAATIRGIRN